MAPPGTVTAASSPLPSRTRGPGGGRRSRSSRQQLELAHRLTIPNRLPGARSGPLPVTKVRQTWSAASHFCTGSARPERSSGRARRAAAGFASPSRSASPSLIFGFLVLTVIDQWSEIQNEGVHFHVGWLIPAIVILPLFFVFSALGWDFILRFLGHPIGFGRAQVAWGQPLLARYVPGSVLYVLGRVLLSERAGVPRRT